LALGKAGELAAMDPQKLFGPTYWPGLTMKLLNYFYDRISWDQLGPPVFPPLVEAEKAQRLPALMSLWPRESNWQPEEALAFLHKLEDRFIPKVLQEMGEGFLSGYTRLLWSQILHREMDPLAQQQALLWLGDHRDLVLLESLMNERLFVNDATFQPALSLLQKHPSPKAQAFLSKLPKNPKRQDLVHEIKQQTRLDQGCLSVEDYEQAEGGLSEEDGGPGERDRLSK
jgi:hypothetical protein